MLTEDKKALKKNIKYKNKVRFCLDENEKKSSNLVNIQSKNENLLAVDAKEPHKEMQFKSHDKMTPNISKENDEIVKLKKFDLITNSLESKKTLINTFIASKAILNPKISINDPKKVTPTDNNNEYCSIQDEKTEISSSNESILRVFLENQTIKSFKYDKNTCVRDVLNCLKEKLNIKCIEYFGLVLKLNSENFVSKFITLDETRPLCKISEIFTGSEVTNLDESNYQCLFRFMFVPTSYSFLIHNDESSFNYLYEQSCNDVVLERFGNELKYEMVLHLATLSILHEHASSNLGKDTTNSDRPILDLQFIEYF